ncbi:MAG: efflux RND transporter permease subunit [Planctomycetaceae bacterium]
MTLQRTDGFYERWSVWILAVLFFLLPLVVVGAMKARTNNRNDVKGWLPQQYEETRTYKFFRQHFQGEEFVLVSWEGCTMDDPRLELLATKLLPPPSEALRIERPLYFKTAQTGPRAIERMVAKPLRLRKGEAFTRLTGSLIGPSPAGVRSGSEEDLLDKRQTCLVLTLSDAARSNLHGALDTIREVATRECAIPDEDLHMGGPPVDNVAIDKAGQSSVTILFGLSLVVGFLVSWWSLKSWTLVLIVLASGVYSMFSSLAIVWYSGYPVDAILLTMPSLVYVATTSGAIHLANYYRDQIAETGCTDGAVGRSVIHALLPLSLATGTTAVGLATLAVSELIPIQLFGIFSAVGVLVSFLILVTFMPALLELFPPTLRIGAVATAAGDESGGGWKPVEESRWWRVGQWITRHNLVTAAGCLTLMATVGYGMTRTESSVQLMRLFSPQSRIRTDYRWLEEHLGQLVPMEILVAVDDARCSLTFLERMELVEEMQHAIADLSEVGSSLSAVTFGRSLDVGEGGGLSSIFGMDTRTRRSVLNKRLIAHRHEFLEGDYLRETTLNVGLLEGATSRPLHEAGLVGEGATGAVPMGPAADLSTDAPVEPAEGAPEGGGELWRISARVSATKEVDYALFQQELRSRLDPILARIASGGVEGVEVHYTGLIPLVYKAQHSLLDGLVFGFVTDFAIIVVVMVLLCRAFSAGLVLLLPAAFPAVCVFGGMGWGHAALSHYDMGTLLIDIGTVMAPSVALGVTVDDVVHFMLWFRRGIVDGLDPRGATMLAYKGCARAMYQSWGVIGIGLSVFALSPFGPTQRFGFMMLSMLTIALVGNLILLPALLSGPLGRVFAWSVQRQERAGGRRIRAREPGSDSLPKPHVLSDSPRRPATV